MIKNILKVIGFLGLATGICALFRNATDTGTHVALIYVLAVLLTARFTDGYVYGVVTAVAAVVCVNYIYTYPYFEMNFTITGYPNFLTSANTFSASPPTRVFLWRSAVVRSTRCWVKTALVNPPL